ncbi:MAG TPA: S8 family serine peptidase [Rudaea sp.]|nr:S8 family serine peptidase [Rudaea sp.]
MSFRLAVFIALFPLVVGAAPVADARHTYMVRLQGQALVEQVHARVAAQNLAAVEGGEKPAMRRELHSTLAQDYLQQLDAQRTRVLDAGSAELGRTLTPRAVYRYAGNGMALSLTDAEAAQLATLPGVLGVRRERVSHPLTDAGPEWIGADKLWNGQVPGIAKTKGEGVVIGIIDTGISPTHPSFASTGADGYAIQNPRGHFYGLCASGQATCNNKLIGIYDFTDEGSKGIDTVGHGTHVAGIAAGDGMNNALNGMTVSLSRFVSGVAPHANIIMYKACKSGSSGGTCPESDLVGAIDQAIADNVDVINYSIGGDAQDAWQMLAQGNTDAAAMFNARTAGIVVVAAAGNEGPGPNSVGEPGNVPWVIGVANATHNREFANTIGNFSGAANAPSPLTGAGYTAGYGPAEIVYAGNYGNALCGIGTTEGVTPTGKSNPFAPGTFHGQIVICDRGIYARVEKGYNVKIGGAGGYILANAQSDGESIVSDDHYLPAVHLGYTEGVALKAWVATPGSHQGTISGVSALLQASLGDILNSSSSRGPYGFGGGILKPDITAPGTNILSSDYQSNGLAFMTGTSMASPNVAGAVALLVAAHPTWGPAQIESALIGTALAGSVRKENAVTLAAPLDAGAGRVQPAAAAQAGLYLPLSTADFRAQDPSHGGDPARLNRPGIESESCSAHCSFVRSVADMSGGGAWVASVQGATANAKITVTPTQFTLAAGASQALNIAVDVSDPHLTGNWSNARIVLHKTGGGQAATDFALTLAVYASPGNAPTFQNIATSGPGGNQTIQLNGLAALPQANFTPTNLVPATVTNRNLGVDAKSNDIYSTFPGTGKQFVLFPNVYQQGVDAGQTGSVFIVEIAASSAREADLYVGIDYNGDGQPSYAEQQCAVSSMSGAAARCVIDLRNAGPVNVWALVDIPQNNSPGTYSVTLNSGIPAVSYLVPGGVRGDFGVVGPGHVNAQSAFALRLFWGSPGGMAALASNTRYYGAVLIDPLNGGSFGALGQAGFMPFALTRAPGGGDVADALEPNATRTLSLAPGETLAHQFIDVAGQATLLVDTSYASGSSNRGAVNFRLTRADFPASSASPQIAAAPAATSGDAQWSLGGAVTTKSATVPVNAGRWYLVAANAGASSADVALTLKTNPIQSVAPVVAGAYYNPQRSGHGTFMNQAAGQQAMYWYTYLEDGTPVWYVAQAAAPIAGSGAWTAPLGRVNWNGSAVGQVVIVGDATLTPIDANSHMFSWHLFGQTGSEHFVLLGANQCVAFNGAQADFTGQWYAPTQSGYGMDVLGIPDNPAGASFQFDAFYFYDALGQPRWAAGSSSPFQPQTQLTMNQIGGFCPLCAAVQTTPRPIGTLNLNFTSAMQGSYSTNLTLLSPLSGSWNINQPIVRLTGSPTCP